MTDKQKMLSNVNPQHYTNRVGRKKDGTLYKDQVYSIDQIYFNTCPSVCQYFADYLHRISGKSEAECNNLIRLLRSTETGVVAGSFIMAFWNDYKENERQFTPADMDIFCHASEAEDFFDNHLDLDFKCVCGDVYDYAPFRVYAAKFGELTVQLISHEYYRDAASACKLFDIDICKMWFDGKKMYSYVPFDKKNMIASAASDKKQVAITLGRVAKYVTRGYGIEKLDITYTAKEYKPNKKVIKKHAEVKSDSDESSTPEGHTKKVDHNKVTKFLEQVQSNEPSADIEVPKIANTVGDSPVLVGKPTVSRGKMTFDELETSDTE